MRRSPRPLLIVLGALAIVTLVLALAPVRAELTRVVPATARVVTTEDHAAFVGITDTRIGGRLVNLVGSLSVIVLVTGGIAYYGLVLALGSASTGDPRRRWRALLVGAPPLSI